MRFLAAGPVLLAALSTLVGQQRPGSVTVPPSNPQLEDAEPIDVAPEPTDPAERQLRLLRNRLHDDNNAASRNPNCVPAMSNRAKNDGCGPRTPTLEELPPGVVGKTTFVDLAPMPELPVKMSHAVLVGVVEKVQTYLSEDKRNIYTEYTVSIEDVLKDESGLSLYSGNTIALDRMGGAIRLSSGRVLRDEVHGNGPPLVPGRRHVPFLYYHAPGTWFRPLKAVEVRDGQVVVEDRLSQFSGMKEATFFDVVHDAIREALRK
jgi:hypothetical protein